MACPVANRGLRPTERVGGCVWRLRPLRGLAPGSAARRIGRFRAGASRSRVSRQGLVAHSPSLSRHPHIQVPSTPRTFTPTWDAGGGPDRQVCPKCGPPSAAGLSDRLETASIRSRPETASSRNRPETASIRNRPDTASIRNRTETASIRIDSESTRKKQKEALSGGGAQIPPWLVALQQCNCIPCCLEYTQTDSDPLVI